MVLEIIDRYNFYKLENEIKKGGDSFFEYINKILESEGLEATLNILKSSGLSVNIFNDRKKKKLFNKIMDNVILKINNCELQKIEDFRDEIDYFESVFKRLDEQRETFFNKHESIDDQYKVASYLMALELQLNSLYETVNKDDDSLMLLGKNKTERFNKTVSLFEAGCESTGMILKYFMFKKYDFKGIKYNISPNVLKAASGHIYFSEVWSVLDDVLEYWKYSDVNLVCEDGKKVLFDIVNKGFELNNLVSNERFNNLRDGWQMGKLGEMYLQKNMGENDQDFDRIFDENQSDLNRSFSALYFGSPLLEDEVEGIKLKEWVRAYELLIEDSQKFLGKRRKIKTYNLNKICLSKPIQEWEKYFQRNGFSREESKKIVAIFTFDNKCLDLIDTPFVKVDDSLLIIPTLTSQADVSRALASNFLNREINLEFKGTGFEERIKAGLNTCGLINSGLNKKFEGEPYQCDVAFILDNELFLIECKAHVQPYTTRQHANHLYKLYEESLQLKRIADFYESNIPIVNEQLNISANFVPNKVHRILLTTSMIGTPLFVNGAYIIDESTFTMFLDRTSPSLHYFEGETYSETYSDKFEVYQGKLSAKKLVELLKFPPQIKISRELYKEKKLSLDLFNIKRNIKVNNTMHVGYELKKSERSILNKYY